MREFHEEVEVVVGGIMEHVPTGKLRHLDVMVMSLCRRAAYLEWRECAKVMAERGKNREGVLSESEELVKEDLKRIDRVVRYRAGERE